MDRIVELIKIELERSKEELQYELEQSRITEYRHELLGGLNINSKISHFVERLSNQDEQESATNYVPEEVLSFIDRVKCGEMFENNHGLLETIDKDVYKVMYYIIKEDVAPVDVRLWVDKNRDLFAREWLK